MQNFQKGGKFRSKSHSHLVFMRAYEADEVLGLLNPLWVLSLISEHISPCDFLYKDNWFVSEYNTKSTSLIFSNTEISTKSKDVFSSFACFLLHVHVEANFRKCFICKKTLSFQFCYFQQLSFPCGSLGVTLLTRASNFLSQ